jgi:hypothetical protein
MSNFGDYQNYTGVGRQDGLIQKRLKNVLSGKADASSFIEHLQNKGVSLSQVIKDNKLSGADIQKLTPHGLHAHGLTRGQNMSALGHQIKQTFSGGVKGSASNVYSALKRGMTEGGGGFRGGVGTKMRYLPMGAKATAMTSSLPELRNALKKEDPTGQGRSQTERIGRAVGSVAGGLLGNLPGSVTSRLGMVGGIAGGMGATMLGSEVGKRVLGGAGKLIDKGVSKARGVQAGDVTNQRLPVTNRKPGSTAV